MACAIYLKSSEAMWLLYLRNKPKLNLITAILHLQWAANFWDQIWHWIRSTVSQWSVRLLNESEWGFVNQSNQFIEKIRWNLENESDSATSLMKCYELSKDLHFCLVITQRYCMASKDFKWTTFMIFCGSFWSLSASVPIICSIFEKSFCVQHKKENHMGLEWRDLRFLSEIFL